MKRNAVVELIVNIFPPAQALEVIQLWSPKDATTVLHALRTILTRGAMDDFQKGLSGALLRVRRARETLKEYSAVPVNNEKYEDNKQATQHSAWNVADEETLRFEDGSSIWNKVLEDVAIIEK